MMYNAGLLNALIENVIDGIFVIDQDGIVQLVNPAACSLFGYTTEELYGQNISILMPSPDGDRHDKYLRRYALTGEAHVIGTGRAVKGLKKNGTIFPVRLAVSEAKYDGQTVYTGVIHDMSQERAAEEKLHQRAAELEAVVEDRTSFLNNIVQTLEQAKDEVNASLLKEKEINRLKTHFVSMASHEFRTPLSSIQLSAALIEHYYDRLDKQKIFAHLDKIKMGVSDLIAMLNDYLSVEKIEAGKVKPLYRVFDLQMFCEEIVAAMKLQAKPGQQIRYHHIGQASTVSLDRNLLQHCLLNLISNAIKYSPEGGLIDIETKVTPRDYTIAVKDNGIGIPKEDRPHLFEVFFRAGNTIDIQGTGLGLNIVKRYVDLMNGTIKFKSNGKTGTIFTITFPVKA